MTFASFVGTAALFGLCFLAYERHFPYGALSIIPMLPIYVIVAWYLPFFVAMWFTVPECPRPFWTKGHFMASAWRSSRFSSLRGEYKEAGPFAYFGFAYLWARHWALLLDWFTVHEDFSVYHLVHEVKSS